MITRRWFLLGSAAAVAAASASFVTSIPVFEVPAAHVYKVRRIGEINVIPAGLAPGEVVQANIYRGVAQDPLLTFSLNSRSYLRWMAPLGQELVFLGDDYVRLEWIGSDGVGEIQLFVEDDGVQYLEKHLFPFNGPAQIIPMMAA